MPDVISTAPADVRLWVALDVHKLSIVAATLPSSGGQPEVQRIETTRVAIRRFIERLGGPEGLAVCYEAGPGGFDLLRVLSELGVACDVVAPSLIPVRAGDRIKTDRRDAKKLVRLYRGGQLSYVQPPTPETEGLRDLMRCRDDLRRARTAARHRSASNCCATGGSTAMARASGRRCTERGSLASDSTMSSRTRRCARCSCTWTALTASSTRSTASWSRSLAASGGLRSSRSSPASVGSRPGPRSG